MEGAEVIVVWAIALGAVLRLLAWLIEEWPTKGNRS